MSYWKRPGFLAIVLCSLFLASSIILFQLSPKDNGINGGNADYKRLNLHEAGDGYLAIDWPEQKGIIYYLDKTSTSEFLFITTSPNDTYQVEFLNGKKSSRIIINSGAWASISDSEGNKPILHLIPDHIASRGYEKIVVKPISGDGTYGISGIKVLNAEKASQYKGNNVIDFEIKQLEIEIDEDDYSKIEKKREEALELGILLTDDSDYVPARIKADGTAYKTELRLKGDWTDHLQGDKWAFRIDVKGDNCIYGMQKFSIQPPETRNGIWERLIYEMYREQGGVALRYDFADIFVNGIYKGVYAVEEFMEKRVIENSQKREGPIVRISEDLLWQRWANFDKDLGEILDDNVNIFSEKKSILSPTLSGYSSYSISLLNKLLQGEAKVEDVFDIDLYARLNAIIDLFCASHGRIWHNMRHYYNPVTGLLEPIPFDEMAFTGDYYGVTTFDFLVNKETEIVSQLFSNEKHNQLYRIYLSNLGDIYFKFIKRHEKEIRQYETIIKRDNESYEIDLVTPIKSRLSQIEKMLDIQDPEFLTIYDSRNNTYSLKIKNNNLIAVEIKGIYQGDRNISSMFTGMPISIPPGEERELLLKDSIFDSNLKISLKYKTKVSSEKTVLEKHIATGFCVVGHAYGSPSEGENGIHEPVLRRLEKIRNNQLIQFIVFTGDLVSHNNDKAYMDFKSALERIGKQYYVIAGNHDEYARDGYDEDEIYLKYWGEKYYYKNINNNLFLFLDCDNKGWNISDEQINMIKDSLSGNPEVKNIFVLTHQLMWWEPEDEHFAGFMPNSLAGKEGYGRSNFNDDVLPLFDGFNGSVYFIAGDAGAFDNGNEIYYEEDGKITYIASGVGGYARDNLLEFYVYDDGQVDIDLVALNGDDPGALGKIEGYAGRASR